MYRLLLKVAEIGPAWFFWSLPDQTRQDVLLNMEGRF
jgi:hypothetical protein